MSRFACVFIVTAFAASHPALADRVTITMAGASTANVWTIGPRTIGGQTVGIAVGASSVQGSSAQFVRDTMLSPYSGHEQAFGTGTIRYQSVTVAGLPGILVESDQHFQLFGNPNVRSILLEPGSVVEYDGITVTTCIPGECVNRESYPTSTVPAVSMWGLIMLGILVLTGGTLAILKRKPVVA